MRIYYESTTGKLISQPRLFDVVDRLEFKRADAATLEIQFLTDGEPGLLGGAPDIRFALKEDGKFDADPVVFSDAFTAPGDASGFYTAKPSFVTNQLNVLLGHDGSGGDTSDDVAYVDLIGEVSWSTDGATWTSTPTFTARVHNDVVKGDEGVPTEGSPSYPVAQDVIDGLARIGIKAVWTPDANLPDENNTVPALPSGYVPADGDKFFVAANASIGLANYYAGQIVQWSPQVNGGQYVAGEGLAEYLLQTILPTYARLNNPNFTGAPTAPTAGLGANDTQIATTAFVRSVAAPLGGGDHGFQFVANPDGGFDVAIWNQTRDIYQRIRIEGVAGSESIIFVD